VSGPFRFEGIITPPRVCRIITPTLLRALRVNVGAYGADAIDSEVAAWIRAVQVEGERTTCADASESIVDPANAPLLEGNVQLTTTEAADELGCTPSNVRDLARRGRLEPVRRKPLLFDRTEVQRYKSGRTA
jgi:DNA-directed RNA polymerase specialized sigma24 family protein